MAAGQQLGIVARGEQADCFVQSLGRFVVERCRNHAVLLAVRAEDLPAVAAAGGVAVAMARHTRSGFSGMSMLLTPSGASASHTALTMQGVEAMVPASPTPFTPMGFTGVGVTVRSRMNSGMCMALGTA